MTLAEEIMHDDREVLRALESDCREFWFLTLGCIERRLGGP